MSNVAELAPQNPQQLRGGAIGEDGVGVDVDTEEFCWEAKGWKSVACRHATLCPRLQMVDERETTTEHNWSKLPIYFT